MLIKPLDAVLVEFTNDAIHLVDPSKSIGLTSNLWFSIASVIFLTFLIASSPRRIIEPRLGEVPGERSPTKQGAELSADESRGLRCAVLGLLGVLVVFGLLTLPPGAPLRNPDTRRTDRQLAVHERPDRPHHGDVPGDRGRYGIGAGTLKSADRRHQGDREGAGRHGRPDLSVLHPQPVRRLLQLHQHGHDHGPEDVRRAQDGQHRPVLVAASASSSWSPSSICCSPAPSPNGRSSRRSSCRC